MNLEEFDYSLPKELIAQYPSKVRGEDRLLVVDRAKKSFEEKKFWDIVDYFRKGDLLVLNNTKVIPARLFGKRKTGGKVEIFIVDKTKDPPEALIRPSGRIKEGEVVLLDTSTSLSINGERSRTIDTPTTLSINPERSRRVDSGHEARVLGRTRIGRLVEFDRPLDEILEKCGHVPLPPYISRADEDCDRVRYQTIYATHKGATASPAAGLHFTRNIIDKLKEKGVRLAYITLHVSYGTFAPIRETVVEKHKMHSEFYHISSENVLIINGALDKKARIFSCGTTSLRALESFRPDSINFIPLKGFEGFTDLFIYPGYEFKTVNALITNFHLPKSTLILLASAFCGKELLFKAYRYAIRNRFKFFSYGDAMLII